MADRFDDKPEYKGPTRDHKPEIGATIRNINLGASNEVVTSYADYDIFLRLMDILFDETDRLIASSETELAGFNLKIDPANYRLIEAQDLEWPLDGPDTRDEISYLEYTALVHKHTRSADFIKKSYEKAIRSESGTTAFDVVAAAAAIRIEAETLLSFISRYMGDIDDAAEQRLLELFQDWAQEAIDHSRILGDILQEGKSPQALPAAELRGLSKTAAQKYQSALQVRLNSINSQIAIRQEEIKQSNIDGSDHYYDKFLGPALQFHLNLRDIPRTGKSSVLAQEVGDTIRPLENNLKVLMGDQIRRNQTFFMTMAATNDLVRERNKIAGYIKQLAPIGLPIPQIFAESPKITERDRDLAEIIRKDVTTGRDSFVSSLSDLTDSIRAKFENHVLKSGDIMFGDLDLVAGARIDGIVPSEHVHDGQDGSTQINARHLLPKTLQDDIVDTDALPPTPTNLQLSSIRLTMMPPGVPTASAVLTWSNADPAYEYQVQVTEEE